MPTFENIPEVPRGTTGALFYFFTGLKQVAEKIVTLFYLNDDSWTIPLLENSWEHYGTPYQSAGYRKDMLDMVHLSGSIKSGTPGSTSIAFILPATHRPASTLLFPAGSDDSANPAHVSVSKEGEVIIEVGSGTLTSLDGITFRVE